MHFNVRFSINEQKIPLNFKHFQSATSMNGEVDSYEGKYEATPSDKVQVFDTVGKLMGRNFVVNPIPKEYGLITYNQDRVITIT